MMFFNFMASIIPQTSKFEASPTEGVNHFFKTIVETIFSLNIFTFIAFILIIYIVIKLFLSRGKPEEFSKSLKAIMYIFIGFILIVVAYAVVYFILTLRF